ncbi:hypothetical protein, partial [Streptomyces sp. NPDC059742]|uniref:hypothetical protein n=1 Tax=Streptomyces sp. NPDC059742 TaxID=3346927 RepID=UPI0036620F96
MARESATSADLSPAAPSRCLRRRAAWPRTASADFADSTYGSTGTVPVSAAVTTASSRAWSMFVWAV